MKMTVAEATDAIAMTEPQIGRRWAWTVRYIVVIVLAIALGAAFGSMDLFKTTKFGKSGLNAARIAEFLSYGGALFIFWMLAQNAAKVLQ